MITKVRDVVAHHLDGSPWPVHRTLPDDVAEIPCIAVLRPRLLPSPASNTLVAATATVLVVGNRINHGDAQNELDDVTDKVIDRFGGLSKSVKIEDPDVQRMVLDEVNPTVTVVAGNDYPCYALTVVLTVAGDC